MSSLYHKLYLIFTLSVFVLIIFFWISLNNKRHIGYNNSHNSYIKSENYINSNNSSSVNTYKNRIHLAFVCCADRLKQCTNLINSALLFTRAELNFIAFADEENYGQVENVLYQLQKIKSFTFEMIPTQFPNYSQINFKDMFRPCATQRLFFPVSCGEKLMLQNVANTIFSLYWNTSIR